MSVSKRLAKYCTQDEASVDAVVSLLKKFKLDAVGPKLVKHLGAYNNAQQRYTAVCVRSAVLIDAAEYAQIKSLVGAPETAHVLIEVDQSMLDGMEISYKGQKWYGSARSKLDRFIASE